MNRTRHPHCERPDLFRSAAFFFLTPHFQARASAFFQSLANCLKFATHFLHFSFQSLTTVKSSKPFVLITIRNAGGCGYSPSSYRAFPRDSRSLRASAYSVPLRYCFLFFPPPITGHGSLACNCFRTTTWEPLATVDSKPLTQTLSLLESTLISRPQVIESTATLSPLDATLTLFSAVTPLESALTKIREGYPCGRGQWLHFFPARPTMNL